MDKLIPAMTCANKHCSHKTNKCINQKCKKEFEVYFKQYMELVDEHIAIHHAKLKEFRNLLKNAKTQADKADANQIIKISLDYIKMYESGKAAKTFDEKLTWYIKYFT